MEAANRKINELEEDKIWQQATINDNELSYEGYLQRFTPLGKYLAQASERLEALKKCAKPDKKPKKRQPLAMKNDSNGNSNLRHTSSKPNSCTRSVN
ncbi:MAG: hypothetical protein R2795_04385 [Saprospiraceae bacterium]